VGLVRERELPSRERRAQEKKHGLERVLLLDRDACIGAKGDTRVSKSGCRSLGWLVGRSVGWLAAHLWNGVP
jgi:hypothetical protein